MHQVNPFQLNALTQADTSWSEDAEELTWTLCQAKRGHHRKQARAKNKKGQERLDNMNTDTSLLNRIPNAHELKFHV